MVQHSRSHSPCNWVLEWQVMFLHMHMLTHMYAKTRNRTHAGTGVLPVSLYAQCVHVCFEDVCVSALIWMCARALKTENIHTYMPTYIQCRHRCVLCCVVCAVCACVCFHAWSGLDFGVSVYIPNAIFNIHALENTCMQTCIHLVLYMIGMYMYMQVWCHDSNVYSYRICTWYIYIYT
jgi:hypothetical protein